MIQELILAGLHLRRGRIEAFNEDGSIRVQDEAGGAAVSCDFLRTSAAPLPALHPGDPVLFVFEEERARGYVLGVVESYEPGREPTSSSLYTDEVREVKINAEERIELRCGESSITMDKEGQVVVKGVKIVSRAKKANKIKGGTVLIN